VRTDRLHEAERGGGPESNTSAKHALVDLVERVVVDDLGVVDQDIDAAEMGQRAVDDAGDIVRLHHVAGHGQGPRAHSLDLGADVVQLGLGAPGGDDRRAFLASARAMPAPTPCPAPVTIATLPSRIPIASSPSCPHCSRDRRRGGRRNRTRTIKNLA